MFLGSEELPTSTQDLAFADGTLLAASDEYVE
jgi:hypothetical protein